MSILFFLLLFFCSLSGGIMTVQASVWSGSRKKTTASTTATRRIVDKKPFVIHVVSYYPDYLEKALILGEDGETLPDELYRQIERDFQMMVQRGINTIRPDFPIMNEEILDLLDRYGLHVAVPIHTDSGTTLLNCTKIVKTLKEEPSTLFWEIGVDSYHHDLMKTQEEPWSEEQGEAAETMLQNNNWENALEAVNFTAGGIRCLDNIHPINTYVGEENTTQNSQEEAPSADDQELSMLSISYSALPDKKFQPSVKVSHTQLLVNGKPFIVKAVCYNPVRQGENNPSGLMTLNPSEKDLVNIEHDFQMMRQAGINTLRLYTPITNRQVLDLLDKYDLHVTVPIISGYDKELHSCSKLIKLLKHERSTLFWEIGNEWNYNLFYSKGAGTPQENPTSDGIEWSDCINMINFTAGGIRKCDSSHPISTCIGNLPEDPKDADKLKDIQSLHVDIYGTNVYSGKTFGNRFEEWKSFTKKPVYFSEFGADALTQIPGKKEGSEDLPDQAVAVDALLEELGAHLSALHKNQNFLGGAVFEWCDEWWKGPSSSLNFHDRVGLKGDPDNFSGPYPDYWFHEEWFGIVDINRNIRPAYKQLQKHYLCWEKLLEERQRSWF